VENLERRVDAITYLKGLITALKKEKMDDIKNSVAVSKKEKALLEVFKAGEVFKLLFSRQHYHAQLAQRANTIFDLFAKYHAIGPVEIEMLWECCLIEESVKHDFYKLMQDGEFYLNDSLISNFIDKIETLPPHSVSATDLEFLNKMARLNTKSSKPKESATKVLWHIATVQKQGYRKEILEPSRTNLIQLLRTLEDDNKEVYALNCCELIGSENSS
jgi:hypothetical protein